MPEIDGGVKGQAAALVGLDHGLRIVAKELVEIV